MYPCTGERLELLEDDIEESELLDTELLDIEERELLDEHRSEYMYPSCVPSILG